VRALHRPLAPRDPTEEHRSATPLELFFDLVFVVAVASAAAELHHGLAEDHPIAVLGFVMTFIAIWWAWMNFTWFASAYDPDDVGYRLLAFVIMTGSLMLAAGVPGFFEDGQSALVVAGYAVMRLAMVALWLRAAAGHPERRDTCLTYAAGIAAVQVLWVARLALDGPEVLVPTFFVLMTLEALVPYVAERRGRTPYHPEHIAERYGLFTIIVLGEVVLSTVLAVQGALKTDYLTGLVPLVAGALLVVFSSWWLYFRRGHAELFAAGRIEAVVAVGYGHLFLFGSIAATGAGLAVAVDVVTHHAHTTSAAAVWSVAVPFAVFLAALGLVDAASEAARWIVVETGVLVVAVLGVTAGAIAIDLPVGVVVLLLGLVGAGGVAQHLVVDTRAARLAT
jgi:low temperature requirement protein LtrA